MSAHQRATEIKIDFPLTLETVQTIARRAEMDGIETLPTLRERFGKTIADTIMASLLLYLGYDERRMTEEKLGLIEGTHVRKPDIELIAKQGVMAFNELAISLSRLQAWIATIVVMRLRFGSFDTCPPRPEIKARVERLFIEHGIPTKLDHS